MMTECRRKKNGYTNVVRNAAHLHGSGLGENVGVDVHHQVASRCVLHDEADVLRRLEARKQVDQEGVPHAVDRLEDPLLTHQAAKERRPLREQRLVLARVKNHRFHGDPASPVHFVSGHDVSLLQGLDGKHLSCALIL